MKKTKLDAAKLQLKKDKVATLSAIQMTDINGGSRAGSLPIFQDIIIVWPPSRLTFGGILTPAATPNQPINYTQGGCV